MVSEEKRNPSLNSIIGNISPLVIDSHVPEQWRAWKQKFEIYSEANSINDLSSSRQVAIFLNLIGDQGLQVFNSFALDRKNIKLKDLIEKFDQKFNPLKNVTVERYNFFSRSQSSDEDFDEYITVLKNLSNSCEFGSLQDGLVKDKFVIGIHDKYIKQRLLQEDDLTIDKCLKIAKSMKLSQERSTKLQTAETQQIVNSVQSHNEINKISRRQYKSRSSGPNRSLSRSRTQQRQQPSSFNNFNSQKTNMCQRCGQVHRFRCPARGVTCKICKRDNHYEKYCFFNANNIGINNCGLMSTASVAPTAAASRKIDYRQVPGKHTVHWFRRGLRLHDNPALLEGIRDAVTLRCVFIINPWFANSSNVGINKWRFLLQCLEDLDNSLKKLNSRLFVVRGQPADALPKLFREWGTTALTFEEDPEPYGRVRDHNMTAKCREFGITVTSRASHTLYKLETIIERNGGKAPLTYHQFQALIASMPPPPQAEPTITAEMLRGVVTPISDDHEERFGVPTLEELGFEVEGLKPPVWVGGETEALIRLKKHLDRKAWVASYRRPKLTPQSLLASETGLSPYLRFGCLSTRLFYHQLSDLYRRIKHTRTPLSLHGQILWREFFYCAATRNPNFDRMEGNPICVQIPWEKNQDVLAKWANGQTGFPWIDAIMIQLREEGWIHHIARHAVACFLTRGDLWISWEEGMKVFDELLLDADWSVNAGMWMWLSCSSFFQQFFHCYCPVRFGRKTDPNGDFIRKYIPVLKNMPTQYIYEPWTVPETVQQAARCVIGRDYPLPMVDHAKASQINIERIKQVYSQLAKYKPQGSMSSDTIPRPLVSHSTLSPSWIIASLNRSNYLSNQSTNPQVNMAYKALNCQAKTERFLLPRTIDAHKHHLQQYKQVVIVPKTQANTHDRPKDGKVQTAHAPGLYAVQNQIENTFQTNTGLNPLLVQNKQDNYNFKNLAINNYLHSYTTPVYQNAPICRNVAFVKQNEVTKKYENQNQLKSISPYPENIINVPPVYTNMPAPQTYVPEPSVPSDNLNVTYKRDTEHHVEKKDDASHLSTSNVDKVG